MTARLLSGPVLLRSGIWNVLGLGLPLVVALFAIPRLIAQLGTDRFGLLAIIWAAIGYFSLFDLGLGRALTKLIAERLGRERTDDLPQLVWTALNLMGILGVVAAVVVAALGPWLIGDVLNVPSALQPEARLSFRILALTLPVVILSAAFIGVLEAYQRFALINAVRIPLGAFTFLGPLLAVQYSPGLVAATGALAVARLLACLAYLAQCLRVMPTLRPTASFERALVGPLLSFGGWLTVSNVVGPLMVYFDRFLIGALLTMSAVAYYATPYELVTRFWVVPTAAAGVLYPALATAFAADQPRLVRLFGRAVRAILLVMFPPLAVVVLFAPEGLTLWLGAEFATKSSSVLRWLALGVFINSLARIPHALVQGVGRPDLTAKLHLLELVPYTAAVWLLVRHFGVAGAAAAWTARIGVDTVALFWLAGRVVPAVHAEATRALLFMSGGVLAIALLTMTQGLANKGTWAFMLVTVAAWLAYREARAMPWLASANAVTKNAR